MQKWIVPFNIKKFDVVNAFNNNQTVFIKRNRALSAGDEVYLYLSKPYSAIKYKGLVIRDNVSADELDSSYKVSKLDDGNYVEIKHLFTFPDDLITCEKIKQLGIGQLVNQQSVYGKTEQFFLKCENDLQIPARIN